MNTPVKLPELFGSMVFNEETMRERLSTASYQAWKKCITDGTSLDISIAGSCDSENTGSSSAAIGGASSCSSRTYPAAPAARMQTASAA